MNGSVKKLTWAAVLALVTITCALPALADKSDYMGLLPEQIESEMARERMVYRQNMDELKMLENGPMDKSSELYRAQYESLIRRAERSKVILDYMNEALKARKQEFRR